MKPITSILLILGLTMQSWALSLFWDPNSETNLAGYKVYWGQQNPPVGPEKVAVGVMEQPTFALSQLSPGTYYFAVTAFNTDGKESEFSNIVSAMIYSSCDVNQDGQTNVLDLNLLARVLTAQAQLPLGVSGDINGDGSFNVLDVQAEVQVVLGLRVCVER